MNHTLEKEEVKEQQPLVIDLTAKVSSNKRKQIGVVAWKTGENSIGISVPYYAHFNYFGDVRIINPLNPKVDEELDLLVIPGGPDVDPLRYTDRVSIFTGRPDHLRESFDKLMLPKYIANKTPIFGICRGHQSIAVHFGASMIQHMHHPSNSNDDRSKLVHDIQIDLFGYSKPIGVNSIHHQIVATAPDNSEVVGWYKVQEKKGNKNYTPSFIEGMDHIEALIYLNDKIATVQYHPEELGADELSDGLIRWLLND